MGLFNRNKKKNRVELDKVEVEERVRQAERDMAYLEAQVRLFRREQKGATQ